MANLSILQYLLIFALILFPTDFRSHLYQPCTQCNVSLQPQPQPLNWSRGSPSRARPGTLY